MFTQIVDPVGNLFVSWLVALVPLAVLLFLLAGLRLSAWLATLIGSAVTLALALAVWKMPLGDGMLAYGYGAATGMWNINWITFWGVMLFNTLTLTGTFDKLRRWLISQGTQDVRVQTMLFAWALGALLEGLVGFGFPWAFVAPILISLGIPDLDAIRVAAIANNAPVSYGALGVPIITLAAVTGYPLLALSSSIGHIVAILALAPPWILIYLVSGRRGLADGWPLAIVGSLGYIAGQFPVAVYIGPYLPDVTGAIICFGALLGLLKVWHPRQVLGYGGVPVPAAQLMRDSSHGLSRNEILEAWLPIFVLVAVMVAWTGPWSPIPTINWLHLAVTAQSSVTANTTIAAAFDFRPGVGGTGVMATFILVALILRINGEQLAGILKKTWDQMWGAFLVAAFIFGLAYIYNFSGMAGTLAKAFSALGVAFIIVAPVVGWIGVALSGSNTSTNAMFGKFQALVGQILGFPPLLLPTLNSVGSEIGKPIAPQTASVGVATTKFVRNEGAVIRHNMGWTFVLLGYLIVIGVACYLLFPGIMAL